MADEDSTPTLDQLEQDLHDALRAYCEMGARLPLVEVSDNYVIESCVAMVKTVSVETGKSSNYLINTGTNLPEAIGLVRLAAIRLEKRSEG